MVQLHCTYIKIDFIHPLHSLLKPHVPFWIPMYKLFHVFRFCLYIVFIAESILLYRVVTNSLKAPRHLIVHDNLKTFTKDGERSVQNL